MLIGGTINHFNGRVWTGRIAKFSDNEKGGRWVLKIFWLVENVS